MKKIIITTLIAISFSVNAQINTRTGGSINVLPNSPTTNTNVGIGTNKPSEKLEVIGNVKANAGFFTKSLPDGQFFQTNEDRIKASMSLSAGSLVDPATGGRTLYFLDMPASNMNDKSFVWFGVDDRDYYSRYRLTAMTGGRTWFFIGNKKQESIYELKEENDEVVITMPKENSFLGIGTTNFIDGDDIYRLSVNGSIRAHRVKVYTTWADFVFEKDYKLPTLMEVEQHIQDKGHLKDIPSAKEVEENGIELGEMNKKLLQKVEELTLYIIEMNKELQDVKSQLKKN